MSRLETLVGFPAWPSRSYAKLWRLAGYAPVDARRTGAHDPRRFGGRLSTIGFSGPLSEVQRWCTSEGLFDLASLVVNKSETPGAGYYRAAPCRDEVEWREYVSRALAALHAWRAKDDAGPLP